MTRLTCLVAEVCTIQLQAQDIHEASRTGNPPPRGTPAATCERKLPVQAMSNNGRQKTEADKSLLKSGGHAQTASRLGVLILHALQSSEQGKAANREPETGSGSSQETRQGQSQPQSRAPLMHEASSGAESPKTIAARDGRSAIGPETAHGYQQIRKGGAAPVREPPAPYKASEAEATRNATEERGSADTARPALEPVATFAHWHEASTAQSSSALPLERFAAAQDGQSAPDSYNERLSLQQPEQRPQPRRPYLQKSFPLQPQYSPDTSRPQLASRRADTTCHDTTAEQRNTEVEPHQSGRAVGSLLPASALYDSSVSPQQPRERRMSESGWDSTISRVVDPGVVVKTRSGLRLRVPTAGERPMTAGSLPSTTAATAAVNTRPFSRHGGGPRCALLYYLKQAQGSLRPH